MAIVVSSIGLRGVEVWKGKWEDNLPEIEGGSIMDLPSSAKKSEARLMAAL